MPSPRASGAAAVAPTWVRVRVRVRANPNPNPNQARRDEAWPSQVRALEAIARSQSTPVVNLRRAIGTALGSPPYTLGRFMKDCRHPAALGHAWIAQLIVHALQQLEPADAEQGPSSREGEGHCPPKSPAWPAAAHCLRNEALRDAVLGGSGGHRTV